METESSAADDTIFCRDCGAEIRAEAEICPECGIRQQNQSGPIDSDELTDHYSTLAWVAAIIVALLSFPLGILVPGYFYWKASNGEGADQGGWETWTVILLGIIGIAAVEIGGEKGAKIVWGVMLGLFALFILVVAGLAV